MTFPRMLAAGAAAMALLSFGAAVAATERTPDNGGPAVQIDVPTGWNVQHGQNGEVIAAAGDNMGAVIVAVMSGSGPAPALKDLAADIAKGANAQLSDRDEPAAIDGHNGEVFTMTTTFQDRPPNTMRATLAVLDPSHIALVTTVTAGAATPDEVQAVNMVRASARILPH